METNVTRLLSARGIVFETRTYEVDETDLSANHVANSIGFEPDRVFKTLVAAGSDGSYYVFVIPGSCELDLKKAAKTVHQKSIALIPLKELEPLTGYVRGGCSPIGMKKHFPVFIDETAQLWDTISVSGGKRGIQIILAPDALASITNAVFTYLV